MRLGIVSSCPCRQYERSTNIPKLCLISIAVPPRAGDDTAREKGMFKLLLETSARVTRTRGDDGNACLRSEDLGRGTLKVLKHQNSGINWLVIRAGQYKDKVLDIPLTKRLSFQANSTSNGGQISFSFYCGNVEVNRKGLLETWSVNVKNTAVAKRLALSLEANKNDVSPGITR
jgi:hypothetical protein